MDGMKKGTEHKVAVIAAAGWKAIGRNVGLQHIPGSFLPLGNGTTAASRLAGQLRDLDFEVFIAVGKLGYPFGSYQLRWSGDEKGYNIPSEEGLGSIGLSPTDSPWTSELYRRASQWGKLISVPDPGWGNQHDTFCVGLDEIGGQWEKVLLVCGDTLFSNSLIADITTLLPWPCQFQMHPCHSVFLLDREHAGAYRSRAQNYRRRPENYWDWRQTVARYPDGQIGTGLLEYDRIKHCGWHNWPGGKVEDYSKLWIDLDGPSKYNRVIEWVGGTTESVILESKVEEIAPEVQTVQVVKSEPVPDCVETFNIGQERVVIVLLTWCGPPERRLSDTRLEYCQRTIDSIRKHLKHPNYTWHIADDNSGVQYQGEVIKMLKGEPYTLSDSNVGGDVGHNINTGLRAAFAKSDVVLLWHDDRFLHHDLDLVSCCRLLREDDEYCLIRFKPQHPWLEASSFQRYGKKWWKVKKKSERGCVVDIGPHLMHRSFVETYGLYTPGVDPHGADVWMDHRFKAIAGPGVAVPSEWWKRTEIPWGEKSTWE